MTRWTVSRWWGVRALHTWVQAIGSLGVFDRPAKGLSGFISGDLHRWLKPTVERLETLDQPLETGQAQYRRVNDGRIERAVGDRERDVTCDAILLQPDDALGLSVAPGRDGDQPKGLPKQRVSGINHANRLIA